MFLGMKLKRKGVNILYEDKHHYAGGSDYYLVFFEDPDRMKVEITANLFKRVLNFGRTRKQL